MLSVAEIMSNELFTLAGTNSIADARRAMADRHIRHIPIVDQEDGLVGLVTQRDVLAATDSVLASKPLAERERTEASIPLAHIMTTNVRTVDARADIRAAALHLQSHHLGCLPVTLEGRLMGIVTDSDFVAVAINLLEQIEDTEPPESV